MGGTKTVSSNAVGTVRIIALQFLFTNKNIIPTSIRTIPPDSEADLQKKRKAPRGVCFIESTENVDPASFLKHLVAAGYELVDAFYQPCPDPRSSTGTKHKVRFVFAATDHATPEEGFLAIRMLAQKALETMCEGAMWAVCAYRNPLIIEERRVPDESSMSINFAAPNPYNDPSGTRAMVWPKDAQGRKMKSAEKVPLTSEFVLRLQEGEILITTAQPQAVH